MYLAVLVVVVIVGIGLMIYQCQNLLRKIRQRRAEGGAAATKQQPASAQLSLPHTTSKQKMEEWTREVKAAHQMTQQRLAKDIRAVAQMQADVTAQLMELKGVIANLHTQQQEVKQQQQQQQQSAPTLNTVGSPSANPEEGLSKPPPRIKKD